MLDMSLGLVSTSADEPTSCTGSAAGFTGLTWTTGSERRRDSRSAEAPEGQSCERVSVLAAIKLLHTVLWAFLAAGILVVPVAGVLRRFRWAAILTVIVLPECGVLAVNGGRCPLTDLAARYTVDRGSNFDIYLANWLAQHNKLIFGLLLVVGELVVIAYWLWGRFAAQSRSVG